MKHLILLLLMLPMVVFGQKEYDSIIFYQASANLESHLVESLEVIDGTMEYTTVSTNEGIFTFKHSASEFDVIINTMEEVNGGTIYYPTDMNCKVFVWDNMNTSFYYNYDEASDMYLESMLFLSKK